MVPVYIVPSFAAAILACSKVLYIRGSARAYTNPRISPVARASQRLLA